jgi:hypothetical protein
MAIAIDDTAAVADTQPQTTDPNLERNLKILREKMPGYDFEPRDEWERGLIAMGRNCGVSLSNEAVSSEGLYD